MSDRPSRGWLIDTNVVSELRKGPRAAAPMRWNRPRHGMVPPDRFIGLAEDTGLIVPIGLWVLREACRRATTWPEHIGIAVNVSPVQLRYPGFCEAVIDIIRETGITPSRWKSPRAC